MNTKRSYLETLNIGRPRKQYASLEDLNRSLGAQGAQIGDWNAERNTGDGEDIAQRMERLSRELSGAVREADRREREREPVVRDEPLHTLAHAIEHARAQEDGVEAASRIASELKALREDLHRQMTSGLKQEFDTLRRDIKTAYNASPAVAGRELSGEMERLSSAIGEFAERSDGAGVGGLRNEIAHMRGDLEVLAREETVQSVGRRFDAFEDRLAETPSNSVAIRALADHLEQIGAAVNMLPESLSLRSLEEKVRSLAKAMERFLRQQEGNTPSTFAAIEERLDEISRAIVASTALHAPAAAFDPEPFERIEARITSLARQLEELIEDHPFGAVMERLTVLSRRVDDIAERAALPEQAVENLARQIAIISDKLDKGSATADADQLLRGMEARFAGLSEAFERRQADAREQSLALFKDLEERLERYNKQALASGESIIKAFDARFEAMADKLASRPQSVPDRQPMRELEARLNAISGRMQAATEQIAGIDPDLVRSLESQVSGLTRFLAEPGNKLPAFDDLGPRLETIERSLAENRDHIVKAARQAAVDAIGATSDRSDMGTISGLADDLQSLEKLARRSDERNTRTFEAIHDTLLKIVDRLGMLENGLAVPAAAMPPKKALADVPSIDPGEPELFASPEEAAPGGGASFSARSPAAAAMEAAQAASALEPIEAGANKDRSRSMFAGLARALHSKKQKSALEERAEPSVAPEAEDTSPDLDQMLDPTVANRPLAPGSGAPDLNAIMKRVRDERSHGAGIAETDAAKSDFIAAARRAAQAAASEAEILKKNADTKSVSGRFSLRNLLRANSKTIVLTAGAVLIALAALQLGKAFMQDSHAVHSAMTVPSVKKVAKVAPPAEAPETKTADRASSSMSPLASTDGAMKVAAADPASPSKPLSDSALAPIASSAPAVHPSAADTVKAASTPPVAEPKIASVPSSPVSVPAPQPVVTSVAAPETLTVPDNIGPAPLRDAAKAGDPKAMFVVATRYAEGDGVSQDMKKAAQWYEKAAERGLVPAEYRIGNFYEKGTGVTRDIAKAEDWYEKAAGQGNASAMHNLAVLYAMGADGKTDNAAAARWFTAAAELGVKDSQFNLGILSAKGVGVPQNLEESYKWFALVAKTGDRDAAAKRDEIAKALRPEQLSKAKQAVELWKAKPVDQAANVVDIPDNWKDSTTTSSIDMKKAVRTIQFILDKNGYDAGPSDGVMGDKTKAAIARFQKDNGMSPTGEVDEKLVHALLAKK